jgi:hypothetical protein
MAGGKNRAFQCRERAPALRVCLYAGLLAGVLLSGPGVTRADTESITPDQQSVLDKVVRQFWPQRPGITDLYFVGFGGDGQQRVFRREALLGERIFGWRMGTATRALQLINDRDDHDSFAIASMAGLRYALTRIGTAMDPKDDVLVLWLTSHGGPQTGLHVFNNDPRLDTDLMPADVRSALDDSGIQWRIVIVSACFAGIFIEPLKSDTTAIITAADSAHTSFGCADNRELTYFGEAFLRDAMPKATSLQAAFEQARQSIAAREVAERINPSNPQIWVGASMAQKLTKLGDFPLPAE